MYVLIEEGKAKVKVPKPGKVVSKEMPVFYNPVMKLNRDISVLLLNAIDKKGLRIADILAASGIRSIRFIRELSKNKINEISINDYSKDSIKFINNNLKLNKIKNKKVRVTNEDANLFLLNSTGFDYIDIDPFGTPNPFLDSAVKRISRDGILAVTATDTAALSGTFPDACLRKYWAVPLRNELMHEVGLRILIRKVQLIGAQFDKALTPVFSYSSHHYLRVFFRCEKGKKAVDNLLAQHGYFSRAGPMWLGKLWDSKLVINMEKINKEGSLEKFLSIIKDESKLNVIGFYDIHKICKRNRLKIPKRELIIKKIKNSGYKVSETHFNPNGLKSDISEKNLIRVIKSQNRNIAT
ncbi:tRNA (guanine(26)-N(2))-dimethyltransferase [Candidatus Woesearchaeota archaeon]|nr:tRNA (guanine(26)-N(2))-dimethyltransferase [Candidatus Woesearchaeota archaeon]